MKDLFSERMNCFMQRDNDDIAEAMFDLNHDLEYW